MNYALIFKLIGNMLRIEALFLIFPLVVSFIFGGEDKNAFLWTILILALLGTLLALMKPKEKKFRSKDAFAAAALTWILFSFFGALPFYFSGCFEGFMDCFFESVSGFTTTGASILTEIENVPKGIIFWRSFSNWIGGTGVLIFMLAVAPGINASSVNLLRAEASGPAPNRIVPRIRETARIMYLIYFSMTVIMVILLCISGFSVFDSLVHAFSSMGTGGFSSRSANIGAFNNTAAEIIITIFSLLSGISFVLFFYLIRGSLKQIFKDEELRFYFGLAIVAIIIITADIYGAYGSVWEALRYSSFQVSTTISTAGFSAVDFNLWPTLSRIMLIILMIIGCCAGSTGGGVKLIRVLLLFKAAKAELNKLIHPRSVKAVTINGKKADNEVLSRVSMFFFTYFLILIISVLIISLERMDIVTTVSSVISMLSNVGTGLEIAGFRGDYSGFSALSKIVFSFCMIAGRLEIFPILILFRPSIWKRE